MKHQTAYQRAIRRFNDESRRQCTLLFAATSLALYRHWGMKQLAIIRVLRVARDAWNECAADNTVSMVQMCEQETGIELQNGDGKSWRDLIYLNGNDPGRMTNAQWVYMRQQQTKWLAPQIMGSILIALHRKHGFGYDWCARVYQQIQEIEAEYRYDPKKIKAACISETGVNVFEGGNDFEDKA